MAKPWTKVETELAKVVVDDLRARGFTVYQEVDAGTGTADIVAQLGKVLWVVECKVSLGLGVLGQAHNWIGYSHLVSVAVLPGHGRGRQLAEILARTIGVGILEVYGPHHHDWMFRGSASRVREVLRPRRHRVMFPWLRENLRPEQQDFAPAGNAEGKRFTAFEGTCAALREVLRRGPLTVREAVKALEGRHHYASELSARGSIFKWARAGVIDGVELIPAGKGKPAQLGLAVAE
jgi:hypothetical protein